MSLFEIIGAILIGPLKMIFEIIFSMAYKMLYNPGKAVVVLSLAMNILVLPLYKRADAIQIQARDTEKKLKDVVTHIKKTFSGDERMMILQTYYRQNNYSPLSVLSGSISLLLEIPFFMAAYQFLSKVGVFTGASFGPIRDLSLPDGLLTVGGFTVNVLPIIMTLINVISSSLYLKGFPLKTKIQLYGMAAFFLVFLYNSPSALVFYWTLNNTFSLLKTLYYRIKNSKKILNVLLGAAGVYLIYFTIRYSDASWKTMLLIELAVALQLPWALPLIKSKLPKRDKTEVPAPNTKLFVLGGLFLTALVGLLIPTTYIAASVQEYIDIDQFYHPIWYVVQTLCLSAGIFLVWLGVFYWLANPKGKVLFTRLVWTIAGVMLVNYMFFGRNLGIMSADLLFETGVNFRWLETILNIAVILLVGAGLYFVAVKFPKRLTSVLLVGVIALVGMGVFNTVKISRETEATKLRLEVEGEELPNFQLSKDGQNVVVIMLDRGIGAYIPYIFEENPELKEQFDGFTHYQNTLSYGGYTNFATPSLYGGYDYTPVDMNQRSEELLVDKHNEALKVVPTILSEEGFDVTLIDPSYANYQVIPDLSVYEDMEGVDVYHANGRYNGPEKKIQAINARKRNFFVFSLMKTLPVFWQETFYQGGEYHQVEEYREMKPIDYYPDMMVSEYNAVNNLTSMTTISDSDNNTYMFYRTNITHEPVILQEPDYSFQAQVDNSAYYTDNLRPITANGQTYWIEGEYAISHYHINTLTYQLLGNWFDYLREQGVYDNTRIIVVSDHGRNMEVFDKTVDNKMHNIETYLPIMLVKDFNATGFTTSQEFMTNADVPALSLEGLVEDPVNPFTGNPIDTSGKEEEQYVILSNQWDVSKNNGTQYIASQWASVSGEVYKKENWVYYTQPDVYPAGEGMTFEQMVTTAPVEEEEVPEVPAN